MENVRVLDIANAVDGSVFPALTCEVHIRLNASEGVTPSLAQNVALRIANVHLRPPIELNGSAGLATARKTEPIRINEAKELVQRTLGMRGGRQAKESLPPLDIVVGDFNEGDDAGALRYFKSLGYIDALQRHVPRSKETHTWPFLMNLWALRKRLDHILWHEYQFAQPAKTVERRDIRLNCSALDAVS